MSQNLRIRSGLLLGAILLMPLFTGISAAGEGLDERWVTLRRETIVRLHEVAEAYGEAKLFGTRAGIYETILELDADDEVARKWCRYKRTKDGWTRSPRYKPPRNRRPPHPDLERKRDAWSQWLGEEASSLARDAAERQRFVLHRRILEFAIPLAPDHVMLRSVNGEVRLKRGCGSPWVLKETWAALKRRKALRDVAQRAVEEPPKSKQGKREAAEPLDAVPEGPVLQGPHVRVLGAAPEAELQAHYARLEATWPVFATAFGMDAPSWTSDMKHAEGLSIYVFADAAVGSAWYGGLPELTPEQRAFAEPLAAVLVPKRTAVCVKGRELGIRLEAGVKMVLDVMVITRMGITGRRAWISEGLNHYLSWPINGTRLVGTVGAYVDRTAPANNTKSPLPSELPADQWLAAGVALLESAEKPDFHLMVGKPLGALTAGELLYGYCIAAWLLEGRPVDGVPFLKAVGASEEVDVDPLLVQHLGLDAGGLEARVLRWLKETTRLSSGPLGSGN